MTSRDRKYKTPNLTLLNQQERIHKSPVRNCDHVFHTAVRFCLVNNKSRVFPGLSPWHGSLRCFRLMIMDLCFSLYYASSVFRWRLSAIEIQLEIFDPSDPYDWCLFQFLWHEASQVSDCRRFTSPTNVATYLYSSVKNNTFVLNSLSKDAFPIRGELVVALYQYRYKLYRNTVTTFTTGASNVN